MTRGETGSTGGRLVDAGTAGAGGFAGAAATGGAMAVDGSADLAATDGAVPPEAETACRAAILARCHRIAICDGDPNDVNTCTAISVLCPEYFFNSASTRTVAGVTACLEQIGQPSCTELRLNLFPSCWSRGTRPAGAACAHPSNCASQGCSGGGTRCGVCAAGPVATGESCVSAACGAGDFCHPGTKLCTPGTALVLAAQGEACDLTAQPAVGCKETLHCIPPTGPEGTAAGTCQPLPLWDVGQPCNQIAGRCKPPLMCFTDFISPDTSECRASPPDQMCGPGVCPDVDYCVYSDGGQHCEPRAAVGEACLDAAGKSSRRCVLESVCWQSSGVCTRYGARGDACNDASPCGTYLVCTGGRCGALSTDACPMVPVDGNAG